MKHWRLLLPLALLAMGAWWWVAREPGGNRRGGEVAVEAPAQRPPGEGSLVPATVEAPESPGVTADRLAEPIGAALPPAKLIVVCREQGTLLPMQGIQASLLDPSLPAEGSEEYARDLRASMRPRWARAGRDGRATFDVVVVGRPMVLRLHQDHPPKARIVHEIPALAPHEQREVVVELPTEWLHIFYLRLLDRADRSPIANAAVADEDEEVVVRTDEHGMCRIAAPFLPEAFEVHAAGFGEAWITPRSGHRSPDRALEVLLERSAALVVQLEGVSHWPWISHSVQAGAPKGLMRLPTDGKGGWVAGDRHWEVTSSASGQATLEGLPANVPLRIQVFVGRTIVKSVEDEVILTAGERRELRVQILAGCEVLGRVVGDRGEPVAGILIWVVNADTSGTTILSSDREEGGLVDSVVSDLEGRFGFASLQPGRWRIGPSPYALRKIAGVESAVPPVSIVVDILEGITSERVELVLPRACYIAGKVLAPDGDSTWNAEVVATSNGTWVEARSDPAGAFRIGPLPPGAYRLVAKPPSNGISMAESKPVHADADTFDVALHLRPAGRVSGRVIDKLTGNAVEATVVLSTLEGASSSQGVQKDGSFQFFRLPRGKLVAYAFTADGRAGARLDLSLDGQGLNDVVIVVEPGSKLQVLVEGGTRKRVLAQVRRGGFLLDGALLERGVAHAFVVPPGDVSLELTLGAGVPIITRELTLAAHETLEVVIPLVD